MVRSLMKSRIFFIGGGRFCKTFIHALLNANFSQDRPVILGIADKDPNAPGIQYAKELGIYTTDDYTKLFKFKHIDIIIELTKDNDLAVYLRKIKPLGVKLVDHFEARALWDYFQIEEQKYSVLKQLDACGNDTAKVKDIFEQFSGFFLDLAKKRNEYSQKTRKALLVSQMAISQVIEGNTIPTFTIDKNHIVVHWNKACEKLTGYSADEIVGTSNHWKPFRKEPRPIMADIILDQVMEGEIDKLYGSQWQKSPLIEGAYQAEEFFPNVGKEGKWLFFTAAPIRSTDGEIIGAIETLWDKTEEKKAEEERERHTRKLATLCSVYSVLNAPRDINERINIAIRDIKNVLYADAICIFLKEDDGLYYFTYNCNFSDEFYEKNRIADRDGFICHVANKGELEVVEDISTSDFDELRDLGKTGLKFVVGSPITDRKADVFGVLLVSGRDKETFAEEEKKLMDLIANRIGAAIENARLQEELKRDAEFQSKLIESSTSAIVATDEAWKIVTFNPEAERLFGYSREDVIKSMDARDLYPDTVKDLIKKGLTSHTDNGDLPWRELTIFSKDGEEIPVRVSGTLLIEDGIMIGSVAFFQDLREIKALERDLLRSERLAAVGQIVAGMAHDVKNILHGFKGGSYLINTGLDNNDTDKLKTGWQMIQRNIDRTSDLVIDLLSYSKEREPEFEKCSPNEIINDICDLFAELANENNIELKKDLSPSIGEVSMDPKTISRVLSNLVSNAIDACIFDEATNKQHYVKVKSACEDNNILRIEVSDNGSGMSEEVKSQLFTCFFSTKGAKGTGLGLLVTRKLIEEHKGTLDVETELGKGTTFIVRLPFKRI